ncbi:hypothetical protein [Ornithinimicrobium pratense]|uniref:hypothetical protein n=1 Tax=Ornithinimicrobium pratense TaxID=2593973 RepID=UPI001EE39351|nr:hypothetical protein [Ornithinimicrobium pratense]
MITPEADARATLEDTAGWRRPLKTMGNFAYPVVAGCYTQIMTATPDGTDESHDATSGVAVKVGTESVSIRKAVFTALFDNSWVSQYAAYRTAVKTGQIHLDDLVRLARKAQIPYVLFFAPPEVVQRQLQDKTEKLLAGMTKDAFSMNSRNQVQLRDVELVVKDLLRKQATLKELDRSLVENTLVGCLAGRRGGDPRRSAERLNELLGISSLDLQRISTRQAALELVVRRLEDNQVLVSQSQQDFMPQRIPVHVKFSGLCIKDRKVPYIFLTGGEGDIRLEPTGRRLFTLVLLTVFVARGRFSP